MKIQKIVNRTKKVVPLRYSFYFIPIAVIVLIGFFDSVYLAISHYRNYVDIGYESFCAISKALNCDTVSQSPYSIFLGVPVPVWGIMGYAFYIFLLGFAWPRDAERKRVWTLLMFISLLFSIYSLVLAFVSSYFIHSYCIMCILSYGVNLALLFYAWIVRKRFACESVFIAIKLDIQYLLRFPKITGAVTSTFAAVGLVMLLSFPQYWHMNPPALSGNIPTGITQDGYPWIGAENPELVITEFVDYRCFQCKKMHYFLRRLIESHPDKIRLVHRNFPMDQIINPIVKEPFHTGAAKLAIVSLFAEGKGKFWEMNDILFSISTDAEAVNLRDFAKKAGIPFKEIRYIFRNPELWEKLRKDIADGLHYGLTGTPGFTINGKVYSAQIPAEILRLYLN